MKRWQNGRTYNNPSLLKRGVDSPELLYCRDVALVNDIYESIFSVKGTRSHGIRGG